jgi:transcriptional regulator with XRE-family HTH domain
MTTEDLQQMQNEAIEQLNWLREQGGLTLVAIGERLGTNHTTVWRWLHERQKPQRRSCLDVRRVYQERRGELGLEISP